MPRDLPAIPAVPPLPAAVTSSLRGIGCMVLGVAVLTANDGIAKWLTQSYPVGQVLALRGLGVVVVAVAFALATGRAGQLRVRDWRVQALRAGLMTASTICFVTGVSLLPLADAIAITFAGPLLSAALAVPLLGEIVGWRRWTAILVGFAGVLVIVRPTPEAFQVAALLPLSAALFGALRDIVTRRMSATETTYSILVMGTAAVTVAGFCTWPFGWNPVSLEHAGLFAVSATLVGGAQYLTIEAFRHGEAAVVAPFKYTSLLWAVIVGFLVWGHMPGSWVAAGAALVVASGLYILHREAQLRRERLKGAGR